VESIDASAVKTTKSPEANEAPDTSSESHFQLRPISFDNGTAGKSLPAGLPLTTGVPISEQPPENVQEPTSFEILGEDKGPDAAADVASLSNREPLPGPVEGAPPTGQRKRLRRRGWRSGEDQRQPERFWTPGVAGFGGWAALWTGVRAHGGADARCSFVYLSGI